MNELEFSGINLFSKSIHTYIVFRTVLIFKFIYKLHNDLIVSIRYSNNVNLVQGSL